MNLLEVSNLSKKFGGVQANSDVSFSVKREQIVGIIGPNGAGKTTTFNLISGFFSPTTGRVIFDGQEFSNITPAKAARKGLIRTFQHTNVFTDLSVYENIMTGQHLVSSKFMFDSFLRQKKYLEDLKKLNKRTNDILLLLELEDKKDVIAKQLSYGDQRKLAIGIALAADPKLLMLDEPEAGMNDTESVKLVEIIRKLRDKGLSILIVEHDMKVVMNLCDYIVVLDQGRKIAEGTPKEVSTNKNVIEVYLGTTEEDEIEEMKEIVADA